MQPRTFAGEFAARSGETAEETRRLAEAVRALAADRDQALARLAALERNLDGVTGTIKRDRIASPQQAPLQSLPQNPASTATPAPIARPETPAAPMTEAAITPAQTPASQQSGPNEAAPPPAPEASNRARSSPPDPVRVSALTEPPAAAAGLGVDVGGAINYEGLRALWHSTKNTDPALLEELYPLVAVRENGKTHGVDLRLVIGPVADADAAARLCTTLSADHHYCQPVAFEGQRLSLNEAAPTKAAPPHHPASSHSSRSEPSPLAFKTVPESPSRIRVINGK